MSTSRFSVRTLFWAAVLSVSAPAVAQQAALPAPATRPVMVETIDAAVVRANAGLDKLLPKRAETAYQAVARRFQPARAMEVVTFMDRYWRVAGNTGFNASLDHIRAALLQAGFAEGKTATASRTWVEEYPNGGNGWELVKAEMTIVEATAGKVPERVFDPVVDYIALAMNSFSTPASGIVAPLVYVGGGADAASYASLDVKGAVVLADGNLRGVWQEAVRNRGAAGVVLATKPPAYTRPEQSPEVFQWGGVPYDDKARAFGFRASPLVANRLKERLKAGPVKVRVEVETKFAPAPAPGSAPTVAGRLLVAEIPGRDRPNERVVMVAHIQEPGANDDASGCGTLLEMARSLQEAIAAKAIPPPGRTITFVWGDEMRASREWLRGDAARPSSTRFMISLDMTGEDVTKTGGSFLIEKEPDPSAVWPRPADPHTEWWGGGGFYKAEALKGSVLNDLYLAVCLRRARDTGWNVQTNPYEGGSDHSIFLNAGIPAALATHFTDRYYHTNLDRADKTSPAEMANSGIATATTAMLLASANEDDAIALTDLVAKAAANRLAVEARQSAEFVSKATDRTQAEAGERVLMDAWRTWYARALESVLALPVTPAGDRLARRVRAAQARIGGS
jgi:aminopeptidase YwaD